MLKTRLIVGFGLSFQGEWFSIDWDEQMKGKEQKVESFGNTEGGDS